jgi:hypothetical protein
VLRPQVGSFVQIGNGAGHAQDAIM